MVRILGCVGLALALVFSPVALAQDKKSDPDKAMPKDDKNKPKDKKEAVEKMHIAGEVTGKLTVWGSSDKGFTVQVPVVYYVLNEGEYRAVLQSQIDLAKARSLQDVVNAKNAMADHQSRLYMEKKENVNIDFVPSAEMKVRILHPVEYDDKGKPKKLTAKELAERKGPDKKLPGYTADPSDVKQDMIVKVYIEKKKTTRTKSKDDKTDPPPGK
jgi:cell division septation protein DedD